MKPLAMKKAKVDRTVFSVLNSGYTSVERRMWITREHAYKNTQKTVLHIEVVLNHSSLSLEEQVYYIRLSHRNMPGLFEQFPPYGRAKLEEFSRAFNIPAIESVPDERPTKRNPDELNKRYVELVDSGHRALPIHSDYTISSFTTTKKSEKASDTEILTQNTSELTFAYHSQFRPVVTMITIIVISILLAVPLLSADRLLMFERVAAALLISTSLITLGAIGCIRASRWYVLTINQQRIELRRTFSPEKYREIQPEITVPILSIEDVTKPGVTVCSDACYLRLMEFGQSPELDKLGCDVMHRIYRNQKIQFLG